MRPLPENDWNILHGANPLYYIYSNLMGEHQQIAADSGTLDHVLFGRNEPALHHYHQTFREALGLTPLEEFTSPPST